jgi:hypothetical protein
MNKTAFVTTLDDTYIAGFLITLCSLLENSKDFKHDLVIFEWGKLSKLNKHIIRSLHKDVIFKKVDEKSYIRTGNFF